MQTFILRRVLQGVTWGLLFSPALSAFAEVNLKDASFTKTWTDFPNFNRTYNSRSIYHGLFGFGWCTDFEKSIDLSEKNKITLNDCTTSSNRIYSSLNGGAQFQNNGGERFVVSKGLYVRHLTDGSIQIFNSRGQLIAMKHKDNIELTYDSTGALRKINFARRYILRIHYDLVTHQIRMIEGPKKLQSLYRYYKDNLTEVRNAWKSKYNFTYDELQNLTRIDYPDKTVERLTYDKDKDWVLSFQDRNHCQEKYAYTQDKQNQLDHSTSHLYKKCKNQTVIQAKIEFWHQSKNNQTYLLRVRITRGSAVSEINYDPNSGQKIALHDQLSTLNASEN